MPILTYDEYSKINHPTPYFYKIKSGDNFLYYFGEHHSFDPKDKQWENMKEFWSKFLKDTENKKRIVFIETMGVKQKETEEEYITKYAGPGLATYLAFQNKMSTFCPEPTFSEQFVELGKHFSHDEVQYYYFARMIPQWNKTDKSVDFETYEKSYLDRGKRESGWNDVDYTLDGMAKIHQKIFGTTFDYTDTKFFNEICSPENTKTVINRVNRAGSDFRNTDIVQKIKEYMDNGYSIFSVYGCAHVVVQEPLLREIL